MVKIETDSEQAIYDLLERNEDQVLYICDAMLWVIGTIDVNKDDDIFYYFMSDEQEPELGGTFELNGMVWERVA